VWLFCRMLLLTRNISYFINNFFSDPNRIVRSGNGCSSETGRCPSSRCQLDPADPHQADPTDAVRCIGRLVIGTSACPAIMRASDSSLKGPARAGLGESRCGLSCSPR